MSEIDIAILDACGFQPEKYEKLIKKLQTKIKQLEAEKNKLYTKAALWNKYKKTLEDKP